MLVDDGLIVREDDRWRRGRRPLRRSPCRLRSRPCWPRGSTASRRRSAGARGGGRDRQGVLRRRGPRPRPRGRARARAVRSDGARPQGAHPIRARRRFRARTRSGSDTCSIRDSAYEAIAKAQRAELHERFADWLERVAGEAVAEQEEIVAYHLEQAHRLPEAARARRRAVRRARSPCGRFASRPRDGVRPRAAISRPRREPALARRGRRTRPRGRAARGPSTTSARRCERRARTRRARGARRGGPAGGGCRRPIAGMACAHRSDRRADRGRPPAASRRDGPRRDRGGDRGPRRSSATRPGSRTRGRSSGSSSSCRAGSTARRTP